MQLTKAQAKLVQDAQAAGYTVKNEGSSLQITKGARKTMPQGIRLGI